ncbi:hypothetical protein MMC24_001253 [Lignoscripta atroalba]|nr:hypothetical protein [Lignoscripta atroalba]
MGCFKQHRSTHQNSESPLPLGTAPSPPPLKSLWNAVIKVVETGEPKQPQSPFAALVWSEKLSRLLARYPRLRVQLADVYVATLEPSLATIDGQRLTRDHFDRGPGRGRLRGRARGRNRGGGNTAAWTQEKALRHGSHKLKEYCTLGHDMGEGLREYSRLVVDLCAEVAIDRQDSLVVTSGRDVDMKDIAIKFDVI